MASTNTTSSDGISPTMNGHSSNGHSSNGHSSNGHSSNGHSSNGTQTNGHTNGTPPLPIVIAGGGCVGLFLALLLAHSPLPHHIIVIEPQHPDPTSTRAMAHQPPTYPLLSRIPGLLPELIAAGSLSAGLCFRTSIANGSQVIASKAFDNNGEGMKGKGQLLLPQGKFQGILMKRISKFGVDRIDVRFGSNVTNFSTTSQEEDAVTVATTTAFGEKETLKATYLIGADGAHSTVRKTLAVPFTGETLDAQLVATDLYFDFHAHGFMDANFIVDPQSHGLIGRITPPSHTDRTLWRVSYSVPTHTPASEITASVDEKLAHMLPSRGLSPTGEKIYDVVRIAPYKAQQRIASTLYQNRVCLIGDAAHLTNPYAGLGLASGIADAASLAEVLVRILSGEAADAERLLGAWSTARRGVFFEVVDKPSRMAYWRVRTDVGSGEKREEFLMRDPLVGALGKGMPVVPKSLETRGEELEGW
jgi:2-polyprenyl-6-methoxyphenol hydroxylase-like FAD-dependent oxidoreductase